MILSECEYKDFRNDYLGYCTKCRDFTTDQCEPDAEKRECDNCGNKTVIGAENALIMGLIEIGE